MQHSNPVRPVPPRAFVQNQVMSKEVHVVNGIVVGAAGQEGSKGRNCSEWQVVDMNGKEGEFFRVTTRQEKDVPLGSDINVILDMRLSRSYQEERLGGIVN